MEVIVKAGELVKESVDAIVLLLCGDKAASQGTAASIDKALDGGITALFRDGEFTGKAKQQSMLHTHGRLQAKKVVLIGLGNPDKLTLEGLRQVAGSAAQYTRGLGASTMAIAIEVSGSHLALSDAAQAVVEGMVLAIYRFDRFKTEENDHQDIAAVRLVANTRDQVKAVQQGAEIGRILGESANFARSLVNHPSNEMTPTMLGRAGASDGQRMPPEM